MRSMTLAACVLLFSSSAWAQITLPPIPDMDLDEPNVGKAVSPMKKGQRAPFTGVLLSPEAVADITVEFESFPERLKLEVDMAVGMSQVDAQHRIDMLLAEGAADLSVAEAKLKAQLQVNSVLSKRIEKIEAEMGNTTLWFGMGITGGVVATLAIVYVSSQ